jgi:hypothetical protein
LRYAYLLIIIALANGLFSLVPWARIHGVFNVSDVGILLVVIGVAIIFIRTKNLQIVANMYTILLMLLFLLVATQASLASFNYGQSIINGLIGLRDFTYYLSFFLFLFLLDDTNKIRKFLDLLSFCALILVVISIINYASPNTLFYHKWGEGHGVRSGITRGFIPAMDILTISLLWQYSKWIEKSKDGRYAGLLTLVIYSAHVFRQSRGRLLSATAVMVGILILKARVKTLLFAISTGLIAIVVIDIYMEENILLSAFTTSVEDVTEVSGSWEARDRMLKEDIEHFFEHPWFGGGTASLRQTPNSAFDTGEFASLAAADDLGYSRWLKSFGLAGVFWLLALCYFFFTRVRRADRLVQSKDRDIVLLVSSYFAYVLMSFITLNHFMLSARVLIVVLCAAILIRINWDGTNKQSTIPAIAESVSFPQ